MMNVYTIGVYGSTEDSFYNKLSQNNIDTFCDIRQRRGVRGIQYKYVNSTYLQDKLCKMGIRYLYIKELAPTKEIRQKQKDADKFNNETKRQRTSLGPIFAKEYCEQILDKFDIDNLIHELKNRDAQNIVLFCVEEYTEACHRSLVAEAFANRLNIKVVDL